MVSGLDDLQSIQYIMNLHFDRIAAACALVAGISFVPVAQAADQQAFNATLAGHAILPAQSFVDAPEDAPADLKVSGKFTTAKRVDTLGTVEGISNGRPTGVSLPFFSSGGTSLAVQVFEMGIILSISRYSLQKK